MIENNGFVLGACYGCGTTFSFDEERVPSVEVDPDTDLPADLSPPPDAAGRARREPICPDCVKKVNAMRALKGESPAWRSFP